MAEETMRLKPCPFCGKEVSLALFGTKDRLYYMITSGIGENACKCRIFMESDLFSENASIEEKQNIKLRLIKTWNTRKGE